MSFAPDADHDSAASDRSALISATVLDDRSALIPANVLRDQLCADARLTKGAAALLRRECDGLAAQLLTSACRARGPIGGRDLNAVELWEALLSQGTYDWLVDRLGFWVSPFADDHFIGARSSSGNHTTSRPHPTLPANVPLPLPPAGLTPDSDLLPRLLWRRAPPSADVVRAAAGAASARVDQAAQMPLHEALLDDVESLAHGDAATGSGDAPVYLHSAFIVGGSRGGT